MFLKLCVLSHIQYNASVSLVMSTFTVTCKMSQAVFHIFWIMCHSMLSAAVSVRYFRKKKLNYPDIFWIKRHSTHNIWDVYYKTFKDLQDRELSLVNNTNQREETLDLPGEYIRWSVIWISIIVVFVVVFVVALLRVIWSPWNIFRVQLLTGERG